MLNKYTSTEPVLFSSELIPQGWTYNILKNGKLHGAVYHVGSKADTEADAVHVLAGLNVVGRVVGSKKGRTKNQINFGRSGR